MANEVYGVWLHNPGCWCVIWEEGMVLQRQDWCEGTQAQAERTARNLRENYPEGVYEVIPFDPDKNPVHTPGKLTPVQREALAAIRAKSREAHRWGGFRKVTIRTLIKRGLVMQGHKLADGLRVTRAGLKELGPC